MNLRQPILLLLILSSSFIKTTCAQTPGQPLQKYAPAALKADFLLLRETLQKKHPSLYRFKTKEFIDARFDSCYQSIRDSMNIYDFFAIIRFALTPIGDGHMEYELSRDALTELRKHIRQFPLRLWFTSDKAYVLCGRDSLQSGTEITAIDGQPMKEIINRLFDFIPCDGAITTGKLHYLNDYKNHFSTLYYLVYGPKPVFTIEHRTPSGEIRKTDLKAGYAKNIRCNIQGEKLKGLSLDFKNNGVPVLTIGNFDAKAQKFNRFLQTAFTKINKKQCKALIIDLRNNGGGEDPNGAALYSWLTDKPFSYYASLKAQGKKREARYQQHPQLQIQQPAAAPFLGKVYFLINGNSFSATAEFSAVARNAQRGVFIGEETGGAYYGNTSGDDTNLLLPNTRINIDIPLVRYTMAVREADYPDRGIIPDYTVLPTLTEWTLHKDVQLQYALHLIPPPPSAAPHPAEAAQTYN